MAPRTTRPRGFAEWKPSPDSAAVVRMIQDVLHEYEDHLPLTMRQIFYRLVATRGYEKTEAGYKKLGEIGNRARRARLIPFADIRDDGVRIERPYMLKDLAHGVAILRLVAQPHAVGLRDQHDRARLLSRLRPVRPIEGGAWREATDKLQSEVEACFKKRA